MNKEAIFLKLKEILVDIKGDVNVSYDTALIADGILDSLEVINYLTQIEDTYSLSISLDQLAELKLGIINNMIDYIVNNSQ